MRFLFISMTLGVVFLLSPALEADDNAAAKAAFAQGKSFFEAEKFAQAADAFREANRLKPNWKLLYNIGQSEAAAKRHGMALEAFELYLSRGGDDLSAERQDEVMAEVERLRKMVGSLDVDGPAGAVVHVDNIVRGKVPLEGLILLAAGEPHQVIVMFEGDAVLVRTIRLTGGRPLVLEVEDEQAPTTDATPAIRSEPVEEEPPPEPQPPAIEKEPSPQEDQIDAHTTERKVSGLKSGGAVLLAVGGATGIGGGVVGGIALSLDKDLQEGCSDEGCTPERWEDVDRLSRLSTGANVLLGVGAGLAVAGVVMLVIDSSGENDGAQGIAIIPSVGAGSAGASIQGSF